MKEKQVVMITGASKGLGRAVARGFAKIGANLAICARGEMNLKEVAKELEAFGAEVLAVPADASEPRDIERFVSLAESNFGKIDVLINNASRLGPSPMPYLTDYPSEEFLDVLRVNADGPFRLTKRVLPGMLERESGSIINVTSEAGNVGYAGWGAYGVSKFALEGLTEIWADEMADTGVRINMVDPGEMNTEMHELAIPDCDYELAEPEDLTEVFLYLASDESKHVNGKRLEAQSFVVEER
ncbi:SDR family NAD(P)-dependent oxidoreductase [Pseudalkalibacillus salsuginis]|uniref:SDR family NAD(P)-dependent oxidoreductase n=1 Tax=Pseudalkalibacillus salsuginis TaxID=2910972 RepID=UPI001F1B1762|nr:SDR family oxidoreductase [Pseudalkalibacillus salsuginis]MCF6408933.1 SDR family oxidoreductase [Pseudalkalibacillus salsuginis]